MKRRRIIGAAVMTIGGAIAIAMAILASVVIGNYVEWANAADALSTVATITIPPMIIGALMVLAGRVVYGEWEERSPIMNASALAIRVAGFLVAFTFGSMLAFLVATGITPDDQTAAAALGIGTTAGLAMIFVGFRIRTGSGRSYLDS
ncbi:MAG: hypothetical protein Q8R02_15400 [Hyphomonadaceae bacterium]|nr:hypothetical protein [Hyphomonadaceae bacterium]